MVEEEERAQRQEEPQDDREREVGIRWEGEWGVESRGTATGNQCLEGHWGTEGGEWGAAPPSWAAALTFVTPPRAHTTPSPIRCHL